MAIHSQLQELLDASGADYEVIEHRQDYRARATAADTGTPLGEFAKTVVLAVDDGFALAVVPGTHQVATSVLARALGADHIRLAAEFEMADLLPGCEVGAAPPFGSLFGLPTYASALLAKDEHITFNAGTHREAVRMTWADYQRIAQPRIEPLSRHEEDRL